MGLFLMASLMASPMFPALAKEYEEPVDPTATASPEVSPADALQARIDGLKEREEMLDARQAAMEDEARRLEDVRVELEERITKLTTLNQSVQAAIDELKNRETAEEKRVRLEEEARIKSLAKLYSGMKPKKAGPIFDTLDIDTASRILKRMKGEAAAKLLSFVEPTKAAAISEAMMMAFP